MLLPQTPLWKHLLCGNKVILLLQHRCKEGQIFQIYNLNNWKIWVFNFLASIDWVWPPIVYRNFWAVQDYLILIKTEDTLVYHTYNREKKYMVRFDWFLHNQLYSVLQHPKVLLYHQVWACCHLTTDTWNILLT